MGKDNWSDMSTYGCVSCLYFVPKRSHQAVGRCRRHAPQPELGWPAVYKSDWCGDHKLDERKLSNPRPEQIENTE